MVTPMIENKNITKLLGILMILAVVFSIGIRYFPDSMPIQGSSEVSYDYESKLFDKDSVMSIDIKIDEDAWNDLLEEATDKEYQVCDLTINGQKYKNVGIRAKGNTTLSQIASDDTTDRYSFKVEFDHYVDSQTCYGLDKLALNNIMSDATYMKEYMSYDLLTYMGVPSSLYSFANVTVNGEAWGLYLALEVPEESYAERNFGSDYGDLYKPESTDMGQDAADEQDVSSDQDAVTVPTENADGGQNAVTPPQMEGKMGGMFGAFGSSGGTDLVYSGDDLDNYSAVWDSSVFDTDDTDHERIVTALKNISEGNLEGYLDVDTMLKYIAVNSVLVNYDSYFGSLKHNYYLYEKDGELTMLPWDYNLAFAGFQSNDATAAVNDPIDTPVSGTTLEDRPLVGQVLEQYRDEYHEYLSRIVDEYFNSGYWEEKIDKVSAMIDEYVKNDATAFYTYDEFKIAVTNLKEFGILRAQSIEGQLDGSIPSTDTAQSKSQEGFVDASSVSITAMGTQGGGQGGGHFGDFGGANKGQFPENKTQADTQTEVNGNAMAQPGGKQWNNLGGMNNPPFEQNTTGSTNATWINLGAIAAAVVGLILVKCYTRRSKV